MISPYTGTALLTRVAVRTGWRSLTAWALGLVALYLATAASIATLYGTPSAIASYGASVGEALVMLNGRVAGLDTLGGVVTNEFAMVVSLAVPLMAIFLAARSTRAEEESGRHELVLAARVGRLAPATAALVVVAVSFTALGAGLWAVSFTLDVDRNGAALYAASVVTLGWVYGAVTAVLAQVVSHTRTLWAAALTVVGASLVTRGIGDTRENWLSWTSPLGWHGLVRPFGDSSPLPLAVSVAVAGALAALALWLAGHRDVGAGLIPTRAGPATASTWRASRAGLAVHQHLGAFLGWTVGVVALMSVYGALMNVVVEAIVGNPALAVFLGGSDTIVDPIVAMIVAFGGFLGAGFALQSLGGLRGEETSGRVELELAAGRSRPGWLAAHAAVVGVGAALVVVAGSAAFAVSAAAALGDQALVGEILGAGTRQVAAVALFVGLSTALFGLAPRLQVVSWVAYLLALVVTLMGPALGLSTGQMRLSPFSAVDRGPGGPVDPLGVTVLLAGAVLLSVAGLIAFRRRDVPRT